MTETVVMIDGMMCGMCESHINDVVRKNFNVKKVSSSHSKGRCVILSEEPIDESAIFTKLLPMSMALRASSKRSVIFTAMPAFFEPLSRAFSRRMTLQEE